MTWEIEPVGDSCRLTVTHDQLRDGANAGVTQRLADGALGLKTLETGKPLTTPASLMYPKA